MHTIAHFVLLTVLITVSSSAFAEDRTVQISSNGTLRVSLADVTWSNEGVTITDRALLYKDAWRKPDTIIPVKTHIVRSMVGIFDQKKETVRDLSVVYDTEKKKIMVTEDEEVIKTKIVFSPFAIFIALAVLSMIVSNVLFVKGYSDSAAIVAFVATFIFTYIFAFATTTTFAATFATASLSILAATAFATASLSTLALVAFAATGNKKMYTILSSVVYISLTVLVWLVYM